MLHRVIDSIELEKRLSALKGGSTALTRHRHSKLHSGQEKNRCLAFYPECFAEMLSEPIKSELNLSHGAPDRLPPSIRSPRGFSPIGRGDRGHAPRAFTEPSPCRRGRRLSGPVARL